ncbi:MAG: hypothetical protein AAB496_01040 [Patescibacteria group bacterium]
MKNEFIITREGRKQIKRNSGYLRLLKDLKDIWPAEIKEDSIWNEYDCYSDDLTSLAKQGFLFESQIHNPQEKRTIKYYKLGIGGFQYLYLRRINFWVIIAGVSAALNILIMLATYFIK